MSIDPQNTTAVPTEIQKFIIFFLGKLKEDKKIPSGLLYGNKEFIDRFQVSTIEKGLQELVNNNVIKIEYTPYAVYVLNEDVQKFKNSFLILLKQIISCNKDQVFSSPLYTNTFDNLTINKGIEELIKENKINVTYSYNGPVYSLPLKDVFLNKINIELEEKNTGIIEVIFTHDNNKYKALVDLNDNNKLLSIYYTDKEEQSYFNLDSSNKLYDLIKQILTEVKVTRFSTRLKLLLIASKRKEGEFNKEFVVSTLGQEYHPEMTLLDALHHCVAAYQEALEYNQLELAYRGDSLTLLMELLKAPSKKKIFPNATDTYSLEEYYNSYINYILQQLRLTNIGWCRKELGFD